MKHDGANQDAAGLRFLLEQAGPGRVILLGLLLFLTSITEGLGLLLLVPITQAIAGQLPEAVPAGLRQIFAQVTPVFLLICGVALVSLRALIVYLTNEQRRRLGLAISNQLRTQSHTALLEADWRWLSRQNSADHAALIMGETARAGNLIDYALSFVTAILTLIVLLASASIISPGLTLVVVAGGALLGIPLLAIRTGTRRRAHGYSDVYADMQGLVSNGLEHLRAARIAGATHHLAQDFEQVSDQLEQHEKVYFRDSYRAQAGFQILVACALAVAVYAGVIAAGISIVILVPMLVVAARSASMLMRVQLALHNWRYSRPALDQLLTLVQQAKLHREPQKMAASPILFTQEIALRNLHFSYPERQDSVFSGLEFSFVAGSLVAVRGASGAGKSTLADLLSGLLCPDIGSILVDGVAIEDQQRIRWRSQVAYVEQASYFFDASVADNLCWGLTGVDPSQMEAALLSASAKFVLDLPDGMETQMGEGGRRFSGGELQRIALARALIRQPDLLILDEISAGLDYQSKENVRQSVAALKGKRTILLLSHDPHMLSIADSLLDLDAL